MSYHPVEDLNMVLKSYSIDANANYVTEFEFGWWHNLFMTDFSTYILKRNK